MWLLVARAPMPDQPYWPGRRWLAALDAVLWPLAWVLLVLAAKRSGMPLGIVGPVVVALVVFAATARMRRAVWCNHRYRFTTLRWGRVLLGLILLGAVLKLAAWA